MGVGWLINNRRSEIEILAEILNLAKKKPRKTKILYKANLNHRQLEKYLSFLVKKDLIVEENGSIVRYNISEKGLEFLEAIQKASSFLE